MKVVILCGGVGTRLREETEFRPKPLVEVGQRPILWHIMKIYAHYDYRAFVLCLGYRGNMIKEYFLNYDAFNNDFTIRLGNRAGTGSAAGGAAGARLESPAGARLESRTSVEGEDFEVTLADTGTETMTGGRIARVGRYVDGDTFMVTYGDGVADIDIAKLVAFHRGHGKLATLTTTQPASRYGVLDIDANGLVRRFEEKPQLDQWSNIGFFVFNRRVLDYLTGDDCILEREPLERLAREQQLVAYRHAGFFYAMDTYREYKALNELWDSGRAPWKVWK